MRMEMRDGLMNHVVQRPMAARWPRMRLGAAAFAAALAAGCTNGEMGSWGGGGSGGKAGAGGSAHREGEEELWTIECCSMSGDGRERLIDDLASALKRVRDIRPDDVAVVHERGNSRILYGTYRLKYVRARVDNPREGQVKGDIIVELSQQIRNDLSLIRSLAVGEVHPFLKAMAIARPVEDVGPPEWDLRNAKGIYTLHVGVTYNTPTLHNYKQAAVEWVKALRDEGFEAYYYHDPDSPRSSVCVGTFGKDDYIEVQKGHHRYSDAVVQLQLKSDFRWNLENGHQVSSVRPGKGRVINQSFLVKIPGADERSAGGLTGTRLQPQPASRQP